MEPIPPQALLAWRWPTELSVPTWGRLQGPQPQAAPRGACAAATRTLPHLACGVWQRAGRRVKVSMAARWQASGGVHTCIQVYGCMVGGCTPHTAQAACRQSHRPTSQAEAEQLLVHSRPRQAHQLESLTYRAENEGAAQGRLTTSCLSTMETNASGTSKYALSSLRRRQRGQGAAGMRPHGTAKHHAQAQHSQAQPQAQRPG